MYIECVKNNGIKYLRLVENRYTGIEGKGPKKVVIKSIGPLAKFDDGEPDYVLRLKESFKLNKPIIESLNEFCTGEQVIKKHTLNFIDGSPDCVGEPKLASNILLEKYLEDLGVVSFVNRYKQLSKIEFDVLGFIRLLIFGRILNPASKIGTVKQYNDYYTPLLTNHNEFNVYDTLDFIYKHKDKLTTKINNKLVQEFGRTTNVIYYDVTNFFFEIEEPDDDELDENDEVVKKGIRKMGVSKENRKLPIVQMGMFVDEQGVPISINIFPGNTLDHLTVIPSLDNSITPNSNQRYIFVGDRGMYRGPNTAQLINTNNGYIISKSIEKTKADEKEWIYDENGYSYKNETFKFKSREVTRTVKNDLGKSQKIKEKVIVYWSKKFYDKQVHENKSMLEFIEKFKQNPGAFRLSTMNKSMKKFIKKEFIDKETGEIKKDTDFTLILDEEKVNKYKDSFGYYQLVTTEFDMSELAVIDKYHELVKIEDQFRTMKGNLNARPLYVRSEEHIESHLFICMIGLIILKLIQNKLASTDASLSANRIITALSKWQVEHLVDGHYRFNNLNDKDLKTILDNFNISIPHKLYRRAELKGIKKTIKL